MCGLKNHVLYSVASAPGECQILLEVSWETMELDANHPAGLINDTDAPIRCHSFPNKIMTKFWEQSPHQEPPGKYVKSH